jgi:hypothetical protein
MTRCGYLEALDRLGVLSRLAAFDPHIAGTPPLGLDLPSSDIDVLCHAPDAVAFTEAAWARFGGEEDFRMQQWTADGRPVIASFCAHGWEIEIFGHPRPVSEQAGWRHFLVERRLLELGGDAFRSAVMAERRRGLKTEPAFAAALGLDGDPFETLLLLQLSSDAELSGMLAKAGFGGPANPG